MPSQRPAAAPTQLMPGATRQFQSPKHSLSWTTLRLIRERTAEPSSRKRNASGGCPLVPGLILDALCNEPEMNDSGGTEPLMPDPDTDPSSHSPRERCLSELFAYLVIPLSCGAMSLAPSN